MIRVVPNPSQQSTRDDVAVYMENIIIVAETDSDKSMVIQVILMTS